MEEMMTTWHNLKCYVLIFFSVLDFCQTLMADRGISPILLRPPLLLRPCIFLRFSNLHVWSFQYTVASVKVIELNRRRFSSFEISAVTEEGGGYGRVERGKRGRKRRELWEELFDDNVEEDDGGGSGGFDLWKILEEIVDNVWILKAFKSYGYLLPFIILSLFFSTGPKAFLVSLAVAIVPSLSFLAFQKLIGWDKRKRTSIANQYMTEEEEERRSRVQYNPSQVSRKVNREASARIASKFGGWDELEDLGTIPEQARNEPKKKPIRKGKRVVRREESREPLLLRLLVSLFPFLSSLTNMLKK